MPTVSILIPAYRPDFLDSCIASALAQTYGDFELLISDDSGGEIIPSIVSKWQDPRIKYGKNPNPQIPGANRDNLLGLATGQYVKFLFDDDMLMARSLELLVSAARQTGAKIAFHNRHFIDQQGKILRSPASIAEGETVLVSPEIVFDQLIGNVNNFIGEPTNILIDLAALRAIDNPFGLNGARMRFLTDVALFTNFAAQKHAFVGVGYMGAAFRQHAAQTSAAHHPSYAAGMFEWELLLRWSIEHGHLSLQRYQTAMQGLHNFYRSRESDFPELEYFLRLKGECEATGYLGGNYRDALASAYMTLELKQIALKKTANDLAADQGMIKFGSVSSGEALRTPGGQPPSLERIQPIVSALNAITNPGEATEIKAPLFSVIVSHFEGTVSLAFLQRALDSLHRQSFQDFEILLYHDGPKRVPFAAEIDLARYSKITRIEESAVRYNDSGHSLRDLGIRQAKGEYIIHMNADNLFYDFAFERIVATMRRPRTNLIDDSTGQVVDTNQNDIIIFPILMIGVEGDGIRIWQNSRNDVLSAMILTGYPCAPGLIDCMQLVMRRNLWLKYGGWYDRSRNSDGPMYQRFVQEHRARYVPAVLGEHW